MWYIALILNLVFLALILKYLMDIVLVFWGSIFYVIPYVPTQSRLLAELLGKLELKKGQEFPIRLKLAR